MLILMTSLFLFSLGINILLVWYIRRTLQEIAPLHERTAHMRESLEQYTGHLEVVYELPTFYGDQTLRDLLEHSRGITEDIQVYEKSFIFESEGEQFEEAETEEEE